MIQRGKGKGDSEAGGYTIASNIPICTPDGVCTICIPSVEGGTGEIEYSKRWLDYGNLLNWNVEQNELGERGEEAANKTEDHDHLIVVTAVKVVILVL